MKVFRCKGFLFGGVGIEFSVFGQLTALYFVEFLHKTSLFLQYTLSFKYAYGYPNI
jgi:hypothetical protein